MTVRSSPSEVASASDSIGATGGAGTTGVSIGMTTTRLSTMRGITREAGRFITAIDSIEAEALANRTSAANEGHSASVTTAGTDAVSTTIPKEHHSLSPVITGPLAAMASLTARAAFARALSAASVMAERNGVFRLAEALASVQEAAFTAADAAERSSFK